MRVHYLQHVPFENLGSMEPVLRDRGHTLSCTRLYAGEPLPPVDRLDWLIVMGGPMGVHDDAVYPWMGAEKEFIKAAIDRGKTVLGVCLGAQFIAHVLGGSVFGNPHREIGWFPIDSVPGADGSPLASVFANRQIAFHWHGDTFAMPEGAVHLARSEACDAQAFVFNNKVVGLQFHLETTPASAAALVENCADELDGTRWVQDADAILTDDGQFSQINQVMERLLVALGA